MDKGVISIIIPAYNCTDTLLRAANSALNQTYKDIEVIIVDDGSTDNTPTLCDDIAKENPVVTVIHKPNGRQASARNAGLKACKGDFVLFLDSDDELQLDCCEVAMSAMESNIDFVLYGFSVYNGTTLLRTPNLGDGRYSDNNLEQFTKHVAKLMASPCNKLYRRSYITTYFDEKCVHAEDTIFNYENFQKDIRIITIHNCLYNVHLDNPNSVNKSYKEGRLRDTIKTISVRDTKLNNIFTESMDEINKVVGSGVDRLVSEVFMMCSIWPMSRCTTELKKVFSEQVAQSIMKQKDAMTKYWLSPIPSLINNGWYAALVIYCKFLNVGNTLRKLLRK